MVSSRKHYTITYLGQVLDIWDAAKQHTRQIIVQCSRYVLFLGSREAAFQTVPSMDGSYLSPMHWNMNLPYVYSKITEENKSFGGTLNLELRLKQL